jgi:glutaredoxin-related protein
MTCEECLSALETESLREISADSAVMRHCATCPDCARVTTMVRDKEYETATVLNSLPPMSDPLTLAETAGQTDQRRRVGGVVVTLSAIAGAIIIWIVSATMVVPRLSRAAVIRNGAPATGVRTESMQLSCLSPQLAADVIDPYI